MIKKSLNPEWNENTTLSAPSTDVIIKVHGVCNSNYTIMLFSLNLMEFFPVLEKSIYTLVILLSIPP